MDIPKEMLRLGDLTELLYEILLIFLHSPYEFSHVDIFRENYTEAFFRVFDLREIISTEGGISRNRLEIKSLVQMNEY